MGGRRPLGSLEDIDREIVEDEEPLIENARKAHTLAGGLNWLATRTRPAIGFYVSQFASVATRCPLRAIELGKRCLRYVRGTCDHGITLFSDDSSKRPRVGGRSLPTQ